MADWIAGNFYSTMTQMENNASVIYEFLTLNYPDITVNAISAILGNMQTESTINPGLWENLEPYGRGFGLVQWTPYDKYGDWAEDYLRIDPDTIYENLDDYSCDAQLLRIMYEAENNLQWFSNPKAPIKKPPFSLSKFLVSDLPPSTLADYFLWFYEHPKETIQPIRAKQADYWYTFLTGLTPPKPLNYGSKFWLYMKPLYKKGGY